MKVATEINKSTQSDVRRGPMDYADRTLFPFKWALPIQFIIGLGLLLGAILPNSTYALVGGLVLMCPTILKSIFAYTELYTDPLSRLVLKGRYEANMIMNKRMSMTTAPDARDKDKHSFVVFLIGARPNRNVDGFFKWMGDAFEKMIQELEDNDTLGYIGSESFVGTTGTLSVQWWEDVESLNAWASSAMRTHSGPWAKLAKMGAKSADYGFWHETYKVTDGNYETIYVNCPPMMLGNCKGVELNIAKKTAVERMKGKKRG